MKRLLAAMLVLCCGAALCACQRETKREHRPSQKKEIIFSGMVLNVQLEQAGTDYLTEKLATYLDASSNQTAELSYTCVGDLSDPEFGEDSTYAAMILSERIGDGAVDYMILDKFAMEYYLLDDVYMDLREFFAEEELAQLEAEKRLIYAQNEGEELRRPIAVKITNLDFVKDNANATGDIYLTLAHNTTRLADCRRLWSHLQLWSEQ